MPFIYLVNFILVPLLLITLAISSTNQKYVTFMYYSIEQINISPWEEIDMILIIVIKHDPRADLTQSSSLRWAE